MTSTNNTSVYKKGVKFRRNFQKCWYLFLMTPRATRMKVRTKQTQASSCFQINWYNRCLQHLAQVHHKNYNGKFSKFFLIYFLHRFASGLGEGEDGELFWMIRQRNWVTLCVFLDHNKHERCGIAQKLRIWKISKDNFSYKMFTADSLPQVLIVVPVTVVLQTINIDFVLNWV